MKKLLFFSLAFVLIIASCQKDTAFNHYQGVSKNSDAVSERGFDEDIPCAEGAICRLKFTLVSQSLPGNIKIYASECGHPCPVSSEPLGVLTSTNREVALTFSCVKCFTLVGDFANWIPRTIRVTHPDGTTELVSVADSQGFCNTSSPQIQSECLESPN